MKKKVSIWRSFVLGAVLVLASGRLSAQQYWYDIVSSTGVYSFNYTQTPAQLIPLNPSNFAFQFQWKYSFSPIGNFQPLPNGNQYNYSFSAPLTQTTYVERVTSDLQGNVLFTSNVLKLSLVSVNWENYNYVREHEVLVPGQTNWQAIDQLPIGQKLEITTYGDGIGRTVQKIGRQVATPDPAQGGTLWGDMVKFFVYDEFGRESQGFLPYSKTDAASSGKYNANALSEQAQYYSNVYNETSAFSSIQYDNSPLNRIVNTKAPGTAWAAGNGVTALFDLNTAADNVQMFEVGSNPTDIPQVIGVYAANTLFRTVSTDEKGNKNIVYSDNEGKIILKKVQLDDNPGVAHSGWACTYNIYDDFGLLRYTLQPEAVNYLDNHSWSFAGTDGQQVLSGLAFRYVYDNRGRMVIKQAPGAKEIDMIYDARDRMVFSQDGNQRGKTEWLATLYDDMDRVVEEGLYETGESVASLQADVANAQQTILQAQTGPDPSNTPDLDVASRVTSIATYIANNSITFDPGFETAPGDNFGTLLASQVATGVTQPVTTYASPISAANLANPSVFTALSYKYYDDYNYPGLRAFDNGFNNALAYSPSDPAVLPIAADARTKNLLTGTSVRVLGTNTFLSTTIYYEQKGRVIQTLEENILNGVDISTNQYHFDDQVLSIDERHTAAGTQYTNFDILTKNLFDQLKRVVAVQKKVGSNDFKTVAQYDFDDMGRLKTKHLDPGNTQTGGADLESLTYSYNLNDEKTGINKDYALKTPGLYDKWAHFYGQCYGYDNRDGLFNDFQLDGHITGTIWSTQGDDVQRQYNYTYDHARRLSNAFYGEKQNTGDGWSNSKMDFSVTGYAGSIQYDRNGNLLAMLQRGVVPGNQTPVNLDDLRYSYANNFLSNQLASVNDAGTAGAANGKLGDFADGSNGSTPDYVYDDNGNVVADLNKGVTGLSGVAGISYNFLDKPEKFQVAGKGMVQIVYDAMGNKLQKIFTPQGSSSPTTTTYIDDYVYIGNNLQYINFEEGRIRVMHSVAQDASNPYDILSMDGNIDLPGGMRGAYDYYVRDIQENVRVILTEETHLGSNTCTMELARAANEEPLFGQVDNTGAPTAANEVKARFPTAQIPGQTIGDGWQDATIGDYVIQLGNLAGQKVGPNTLMKVMAGDAVSAKVIYYYKDPVVNQSGGTGLVTDVLTSLAAAIGGSPTTSSLLHGSAATSAVAPLNGSMPFSTLVDPNLNDASGSAPKAYLTVLFFDERFNFIQEGSIAARVQQSGNGAPTLVLPDIKAPKNGYAYVYVSNESDETVYFDNLQVTNDHGVILEEDHYYAYGLKIAGISSKVLPDPNEGFVQNKNLYNDKELIDEADLDWYDYGFRNYDPQIGRFTQLDPLTDDYRDLTPYQYASDEPIANIDLDGLEGDLASVAGSAGAASAALGNTGVAALVLLSPAQAATLRAARLAKSSTTCWSIGGSFLKGVGQSIWGGVKGVVNMGLHPITTATNIAHAIAHPGQTYHAIKAMVKETYHEFKNGDANTRANLIGKMTGEGFQIFAGGPIVDLVKGASKVAEGGKVLEEAAKVGSELEKTEEIVNEASKTGNMAQDVNKVERGAAETKVPCGCFLPGTLVLTDSGYKRIEQIRPGDIVMAYNDTAHAYGRKKVIRIFEHVRDTVYELTVGADVIRTTSDHPFFVGGRWLRVKELRPGDSVVTYSGAKLMISSIHLVARRTTVHNFEVADFHTYYVSGQKVLVHNNGPCDVPVKQGSKAWSEARKDLSNLKGKDAMDVTVETATDAKKLLQEARGNMNRFRNYTKKVYKKGFETHNVQNAREIKVGNTLKHLKWKDGKVGGHIFYFKPN